VFPYSKKYLILFVTVLCLVSVIVYRIFFCESDEIVLNGNVEIQNTDVSFRVSGRIKEIFVEEGKRVMRGDVIAKLDDDTFSAKVKCAQAAINESEVILKMAVKNW
jgi:HlyD family secretion protein